MNAIDDPQKNEYKSQLEKCNEDYIRHALSITEVYNQYKSIMKKISQLSSGSEVSTQLQVLKEYSKFYSKNLGLNNSIL